MTYKVGDKLWWVSSHNTSVQGVVTVTRVGRKWLSLSNAHRVDIDSLLADGKGYSSPGRCYQSLDEYVRLTAIADAWDAFKSALGRHYRPPASVTVSDILAAANLCGVTVNLDVNKKR